MDQQHPPTHAKSRSSRLKLDQLEVTIDFDLNPAKVLETEIDLLMGIIPELLSAYATNCEEDQS